MLDGLYLILDITGWGFDDHPKEGFFSPVIPSYHVHHRGPYNVPLRSLYSRGAPNLLLAGRLIGARGPWEIS